MNIRTISRLLPVLILVIALTPLAVRAADTPPVTADTSSQPVLMEFGAGWCLPCKMMRPLLEKLQGTYRGQLDIQLIDVDEQPELTEQYGIATIPTLIFFSPDGVEQWRHTGVISKDELLTQFESLGLPRLEGDSADEREDQGWGALGRIQQLLAENLGIAAGAAFLWGIIGILLNPCQLSTLPLIIGYISGMDRDVSKMRVTLYATLFAGGVLVTIVIAGGLATLAGVNLTGLTPYLSAFIGVILVAVAGNLLGWYEVTIPGVEKLQTARRGAAGAVLLGASAGVVSAPCSFAFILPLLAIVAAQGELARGLLLTLCFALGYSLPLIGLSVSSQFLKQRLLAPGFQQSGKRVKQVGGVLFLLLGLYLIFS